MNRGKDPTAARQAPADAGRQRQALLEVQRLSFEAGARQRRAAVRRLKLLCLVSWTMAVLLPVAAMSFVLIAASAPDGSDGGFAALLLQLAGALAAAAFVAAIITTVLWYRTSRGAADQATASRLAELQRSVLADMASRDEPS